MVLDNLSHSILLPDTGTLPNPLPTKQADKGISEYVMEVLIDGRHLSNIDRHTVAQGRQRHLPHILILIIVHLPISYRQLVCNQIVINSLPLVAFQFWHSSGGSIFSLFLFS